MSELPYMEAQLIQTATQAAAQLQEVFEADVQEGRKSARDEPELKSTT